MMTKNARWNNKTRSLIGSKNWCFLHLYPSQVKDVEYPS